MALNGQDKIRLAFDGDAVIFSDESERIIGTWHGGVYRT